MRSLSILATFTLGLALATQVVACSGGSDPDPEPSTQTNEEGLMRGGLGANGDNCSIDLPNGTKEPGADDGNGHCCSVFDATKCVDLPKSSTLKARGFSTSPGSKAP